MAENTQYQKVKEITDQLEQGIQDLFQSEKYMEWLKTMSKFHDYSLNNTLLIAFQKPDATLVAGYTAWQKEFGRQVMKGEKAIKILAPAPYKQKVEMDKIDPITQKPVLDAEGNPVKEVQEIKRPAFKVVNVFDVSQTDGKEIPSLGVNELTGDVQEYEFMGELQKNLLEGNEKAEDVLGWFVQEMDAETDYSDPATDLYIEMKNFVKDGKEIYKQEQATKLATELYDYADEVDPYGSQDSVEYVDEFIRDTTKDLLDAGEKAEGIMKWLKETPVATEELEQRGKELIEKVSNFTGIPMEQEATITFYVAECMEFPNLGECHENLTLDEAMKIYEKIPADRTFKIRYDGMVGDVDILPYDISMAEYSGKVKMVSEGYNHSEAVSEIRKYEAIDADRHPQFPDDVGALLFKEGVQMEKVWVRTNQIINGKVAGTLLNQPNSPKFGLNRGDVVTLVTVPADGRRFTVVETPDIYS